MCVNANAYNNALWVQCLTFNTWNSTWTLHSIINASAGCVLQLIICNINSITSTSFVFNFKRPSRGKNTFGIKVQVWRKRIQTFCSHLSRSNLFLGIPFTLLWIKPERKKWDNLFCAQQNRLVWILSRINMKYRWWELPFAIVLSIDDSFNCAKWTKVVRKPQRGNIFAQSSCDTIITTYTTRVPSVIYVWGTADYLLY